MLSRQLLNTFQF